MHSAAGSLENGSAVDELLKVIDVGMVVTGAEDCIDEAERGDNGLLGGAFVTSVGFLAGG